MRALQECYQSCGGYRRNGCVLCRYHRGCDHPSWARETLRLLSVPTDPSAAGSRSPQSSPYANSANAGWGIATSLIGAVLAAKAAFIPAKALAAQVLLERAFERSQFGDAKQRLWPWADLFPIARIRVPRLDKSAVVVDSATGQGLAFGPAHLTSSAPLGTSGVAVIAGHRDTHFAFLRDVVVGDTVVLTLPNGREILALVTCYPLDGVRRTRQRLVVWAEQVTALDG